MINLCSRALALLSFCVMAAWGQTTQGLISGQLVNSVTGRPISRATVLYSSSLSNLAGASASDETGYYYLPLLSPGFYQIRVNVPGYQSQEIQQLELTVAARVELDFRLRPLSDVWEAGQYNSVFLPGSKTIVTFYGPDVDPTKTGSFEAQKGRRAPLESTVSEVIDSGEIDNLPLEGRDVYTMLITQPGVTSDAALGRGLGLSVNGQRPSASNFLLDGVENNNYLITGPLNVLPPEAIQEYRISTNNFSAEYGRTSGFLANAITRSGSNAFHSAAYLYLINDVLNANGFQENLIGAARTPQKQVEPGYVFGGPVLKDRLFFLSTFDYFHSGSRQAPFTFIVPSTNFVPQYTAPGSLARQLLSEFPAPAAASGNLPVAPLTLAPPVTINRKDAIERFDYSTPSQKDRLMGRVLFNRLERPDFIWSPYKDFVSALNEYSVEGAVSHVHLFRPDLTNEARFSVSDDNLHWNRPHPEIPTLAAAATFFPGDVTLPGSPAFYAYKNANKSWELLDNVIWSRGQHLVTAGAGLLLRSSDGYLTAGQDGEYIFPSIVSFALGQPLGPQQPVYFAAPINRATLPNLLLPDFNRSYAYTQYFLFAQDTYKLTPRLTVNYGARYEFYGGPKNVGATKDQLVQLGSGSTLAQQLVGARLAQPGAGDQQLFGSDKSDFALRVGAAYDLLGSGKTLVRGAYGTFYDRPFDNLWENLRNNSFILPLLTFAPGPVNYLAPVATQLAKFAGQSISSDFPDLTLVDPGLRNGYTRSYFAGVQQRITDDFAVEVNALGSYGRKLITTDIINRDFSTPAGRYNPNLPDIAYRANQGFSDYNALTAVARYRTSRGIVQASYTWSHSIDNQSDPLIGDFFNLNFTAIQSASASLGRSSFSEQFNARVDRGSSDFDQRQNLVIFSYLNLPNPVPNSRWGWLLRDWTTGELAAFRSGFPFTVLGTSTAVPGGGLIINNRPNILDPRQTVFTPAIPVPGGERLLNPAGFAEAAPSTLGNEGRNAFTGPGFYSLDVSLARSFPVHWLGEGGRLRFRADAFNVLNHANLGNPDPFFTFPLSSTFGIATFGRQGVQSGFPAISPLNETPRQVQLSVKVEF
ncbi:MAG TPA: carboxypeptidase regulatory-like domain-containing protein [Bryobacteraceae bacterium]|nr:carboxypeptidase regulatory-like domain-containing protein [Bryobacteraceae bacterium]